VIADVVRYVADLLADATTGVNALLAGVPQPAGDGALPAVTIYNEMDDAVTALGPIDPTLLADGPALLVCFVGSVAEEIGPRTLGADAMRAGARALRRAGARRADLRARGLADAPRRDARAPRPGPRRSRRRVTVGQGAPRTPSRVAVLRAAPGGGEAFTPALLVTVPATDAWALGA
jgi:hypothetical protein